MEGISPGKYANAELMKIPNFLHLTPAHVKKHCEALKGKNFLTRCKSNNYNNLCIVEHSNCS